VGCFHTIILLSGEVLYAQHVFVEQTFSYIFPGCSGMPQISSVLNVCCVLTLGMGLPEGTAESGDVQMPLLKLVKVKMYRIFVGKWCIASLRPLSKPSPPSQLCKTI